MADLIVPDDWEDAEVDLTRPAMSQAETWRVDSAAGTVEHVGTAAPGFGVVTFPTRLINGEFSATVTVTDPGRYSDSAANTARACAGSLVFRHLDPDRYYAFGIGGWGFNWSLFYTKPAMDAYRPWRFEGQQGDEQKRSKQFTFELTVRMLGSSLECFVNGSRRFSEILPPDAHYLNGQVGFYAYLDSPVRFSKIRLRRAPLTCFIVSPINPEFDSTVYGGLKQQLEQITIDRHPLRCRRADQNTKSEPFIRTIIKQMKSANITVVLVPGDAGESSVKDKNENVFYELGVAHALNLPVVVYAKDEKRMPADLRHLNIIKSDDGLVSSVREILSKDTYQQVYVA